MILYDTLSRKNEDLIPHQNGHVKIYTCGLTVYSHPHIGNWIGYIYWDVLVRVLQTVGYDVERTQNITDVGHLTSDDDSGEDKMEKGARREGITAWDVAEKYIQIANNESKMLGLLEPNHLVRATDMISEQIAFTKILDEKGYLYKIEGDGMYFDTSKLRDYGKLARLDIAGLEAGIRVSVEGKRSMTDFAVWKFSPTNVKRDMEWESPWGIGFPGWHLECSVIAQETLGDQIDIHTGGIDHIPVHHTNEIAQTESVTDKKFSQIWLHVNHLKVDGKKMSKSLGNVYYLQDILDKGYDLDAFKVFTLGKHYSKEGNFTWENLDSAQNRLKSWRQLGDLVWQTADITEVPSDPNNCLVNFMNALLNDNLNTPLALSVIDELNNEIMNHGLTPENLFVLTRMLERIKDCFGIELIGNDITEAQKKIIIERETHRINKNWSMSDELRDKLKAEGIGLRDTTSGVIWYHL